MRLKEETLAVHEITDFKTEFAGVTKPGEFLYTHGGKVPSGLDYHIHYTTTKQVVYMTGGTHMPSSKIIEKVLGAPSMLESYSDLGADESQEYPQRYVALPTESEYRVGVMIRYFAQKVNDTNSELFEVSEDDFNFDNELYRFFSIDWKISGARAEVLLTNLRTMRQNSVIQGNGQLMKLLFPLQLWRPDPESKEDLTRKLGRLKNTLVIPVEVEVVPPPPYRPDNRYEIMDNITVIDRLVMQGVTNIVRDEDGNPVIGFIDGTRVDLTESGP